MPHFILDLSKPLLKRRPPNELIRTLHDTADASGLFARGDIKVRLRPYKHYTVGNAASDFIHVFAYIMEGRTVEQRRALSTAIVGKLKGMYPDVPVISMNVMEFERATYANKSTV
jgi:5-carboxymethyl-2-hydroxymuconate isomerase